MIEHHHCADECEHPQPFRLDDGVLYCGKCWYVHGVMTPMVLCTPQTCPD